MKVKIFAAFLLCLSAAVFAGCFGYSPLVGRWEAEDGAYSYEFKKDKTGAYSIGDEEVIKFIYEDKGKSVEIAYEGNDISTEILYSVNGGVLSITDSVGGKADLRRVN